MNILYLSRTMGQGGAEKVVYQLCKDSNGFQKKIVVSCGGSYVQNLEKIGVKHYLIPDLVSKNPVNIIRTLKILSKLIKTQRIEIIHTHHRMAAFYARILQFRFPRLKHVYTAHNVFYDKKNLLRFALSKAVIVACGVTVENNLVKFYRINPHKISLIYNSIEKPSNINSDDEIASKLVPSNGKYYIGNIGRLSYQKGIDVFIRAISKVVKIRPEVMGVIIGDGEEKDELIKLVQKLNIEKQILFLGYQRNVFPILRKMQFVVLSSRWEGFPLTPIETFACRKTIIVSNIKNNLEIVNPGINGLAFEKDNVDDLVQKILLMIKRKSKLEGNAYLSYIKHFSYSKFIEEYDNVYKNLMIND